MSVSKPVPANFIRVPHQSRFSRHMGIFYVPEDQSSESEYVKVGMLLEEPHTGGSGRGHGGVTMTLLDEAMGRAASEAAGCMCMTISMTTNFCSSTEIGGFICASARVTRRGQNIVFVDGELHDSRGRLVGSATGTWVNTQEPIPGR